MPKVVPINELLLGRFKSNALYLRILDQLQVGEVGSNDLWIHHEYCEIKQCYLVRLSLSPALEEAFSNDDKARILEQVCEGMFQPA